MSQIARVNPVPRPMPKSDCVREPGNRKDLFRRDKAAVRCPTRVCDLVLWESELADDRADTISADDKVDFVGVAV
jgi:hypothetical protein